MTSMIKTKIAIVAGSMVAISGSAHALPALLTPTGFGPASASSWVAGAAAGYNWQRGAVVFGLEGDINGLNLRSETVGTYTSPFPLVGYTYPSGDTIAKVDWYGTIRGRLGCAVGSFLFYGTGGLAYGGVGLTNNFTPGYFGTTSLIGPLNAQTSSVKVGWVAGVGVDYLLTHNLIIGLQYQYVDLGSVSQAALTAPAPFQAIQGAAAFAHAQFQVATLGLSYKFPPPVSSRDALATDLPLKAPPPPSSPWAGFYVGGHAGGAWGNNVTVTPPNRVLPPA